MTNTGIWQFVQPDGVLKQYTRDQVWQHLVNYVDPSQGGDPDLTDDLAQLCYRYRHWKPLYSSTPLPDPSTFQFFYYSIDPSMVSLIVSKENIDVNALEQRPYGRLDLLTTPDGRIVNCGAVIVGDWLFGDAYFHITHNDSLYLKTGGQ